MTIIFYLPSVLGVTLGVTSMFGVFGKTYVAGLDCKVSDEDEVAINSAIDNIIYS